MKNRSASEQTNEFKKQYFAEFGEEISDEKAMALGTKLLTLFQHIYRPVKKDWLAVVSDDQNSNKI